MRKEPLQAIVFASLLGAGTLASWKLQGAPGPAPKVKTGPGSPITQPGPSFKLTASAKKASTRLVPNLPNAPKTSRSLGQPWLLRPLASKCVIGGECLIRGLDLGQHEPGKKSPAGWYLSFYASGTMVSDVKLDPTVWTASLVGFKPPATMHAGRRYTVLIRDAKGKALSNGIELDVVAVPDPRTHPDFDGDGELSIAAGGTDCDDFDRRRGTKRTEIADPEDLDEDCQTGTFGVRDLDGDGSPDVGACNIGVTGTGLDRTPVWYCGEDCDDTKVAVKPGELVCDARDASLIFMCVAKRQWTVDPRATANVGCMEPYSCSSMVAGGECVHQPNGRGVCSIRQ